MRNGPLITKLSPEEDFVLLAGAELSVQIKTRKNIHGVFLNGTVAGAPAADADWVTDVLLVSVQVDERYIVEPMTPAELRAINNRYTAKTGALADNGDLPLIFIPDNLPWRGSGAQYRIGMLQEDGTGRNSIMRITLLYGAGPLTITRIKPYVLVDDDDPGTIGAHIRWRVFNHVGPAGQEDITTLPIDKNCVGALSFWFPNGVNPVDTFTVIRNNARWYDQIPVAVFNREQIRAGMTPQAGYDILPFDQNNDPSSILPYPGIDNLTVSPVWTGAPGPNRMLMQLAYMGLG